MIKRTVNNLLAINIKANAKSLIITIWVLLFKKNGVVLEYDVAHGTLMHLNRTLIFVFIKCDFSRNYRSMPLFWFYEWTPEYVRIILYALEYFFIFLINMFYLPVLANPGISELFLKAINCKVGVTFVLEEALAFIPQSNRVRIKCSWFWWKELKRYFLWLYGSNINLRVFRILKEGILSILIDWSER